MHSKVTTITNIEKIKIKKSKYYDGAFTISDKKGHYFLNNPTITSDDRVSVQQLFYTYKWYEDTVYFSKDNYEKLMKLI